MKELEKMTKMELFIYAKKITRENEKLKNEIERLKTEKKAADTQAAQD